MGKDFGGKMYTTSSTGSRLSMRGTFSVMPAKATAEGVTGQDGRVDRTITPIAASAEITFADDNHDYDDFISGDRRDYTIVEEKTNVAHYFTDAFMTGTPSVNRLNGEVSGLTLTAQSYRRAG